MTDDRRPQVTATLLAPVNLDAQSPPLFCVFGTELYRPLAEALGPEQAVYGMVVEGDFDEPAWRWWPQPRPRSIEALAELYLPEVRRLQPHGPYHFAGFCYAGRVAFEMARRVRAAGEEVALLAGFDSFMPGAVHRPLSRLLAWHAAEAKRHPWAYLLGRLRRQPMIRPRHGLIEQAATSDNPGVALRRMQAFQRHSQRGYRPQPYPGMAVLFRATDNHLYAPAVVIDPLLGWRGLAREGLDVHDVPGDHLRLFSGDNPRLIAATLRRYLAPTAIRSTFARDRGRARLSPDCEG
jgi:thioesterase domain-containing protein